MDDSSELRAECKQSLEKCHLTLKLLRKHRQKLATLQLLLADHNCDEKRKEPRSEHVIPATNTYLSDEEPATETPSKIGKEGIQFMLYKPKTKLKKPNKERAMKRQSRRVRRGNRENTFNRNFWTQFDVLAARSERLYSAGVSKYHAAYWHDFNSDVWHCDGNAEDMFLKPKYDSILISRRAEQTVYPTSMNDEHFFISSATFNLGDPQMFPNSSPDINLFEENEQILDYNKIQKIFFHINEPGLMEELYEESKESVKFNARPVRRDEFEIGEAAPLREDIMMRLFKLFVAALLLGVDRTWLMVICGIYATYYIGFLTPFLTMVDLIRLRYIIRPNVQQLPNVGIESSEQDEDEDLPPYVLRLLYQTVVSFVLGFMPWWRPNPRYIA